MTLRARPALVALASALALALALTGCAPVDQTAIDPAPRYEDGGQLGDAGYFYDALSPYGRWVELEPYGMCWLPDGLGPGWSPYSQGTWAYSDYGWTWVDQESWGWAPFHYGRWWLDPQYGWVWIPGTEWAPAWVAWREGDAYVAWAPLPPTIHWSFDVPLYSGGPSVASLPDTWWNVAQPENLVDPQLRSKLVPLADKAFALARTEDRTRITVQGGHPFNEGVSVNLVERRMGRTLPRYQVVDAPGSGSARAGQLSGGNATFYRPALEGRARRGIGRPGLRERPPEATVVPAPARPAPVASSVDSTRLVTMIDEERTRLANDQGVEAKRAADGPEAGTVAQRHAREQRAFGAWVERQWQVLGRTGAFRPAKFDRHGLDLFRRITAPRTEPDSTRGAR